MSVQTQENNQPGGIDVADQGVIRALQANVPQDEIKWRQASYDKKNSNVRMLAYVDARYVMDALDNAVGIPNWTTEYMVIKERLFCKITITFPSGRAVSKMDCGAETTFEAEKGVVSDALKRTAVLFGIGRDLYSLGDQWAETNERGYIDRSWAPPLLAVEQPTTSQNPTSKSGNFAVNTPEPTPAPSPPSNTASGPGSQDSTDSAATVQQTPPAPQNPIDAAHEERFEAGDHGRAGGGIEPPPPEGRSADAFDAIDSVISGNKAEPEDGNEFVAIGELTCFSDPNLNKAIWVGVPATDEKERLWIPKSNLDEHTFTGKHSSGAIFVKFWYVKANLKQAPWLEAWSRIKKS